MKCEVCGRRDRKVRAMCQCCSLKCRAYMHVWRWPLGGVGLERQPAASNGWSEERDARHRSEEHHLHGFASDPEDDSSFGRFADSHERQRRSDIQASQPQMPGGGDTWHAFRAPPLAQYVAAFVDEELTPALLRSMPPGVLADSLRP